MKLIKTSFEAMRDYQLDYYYSLEYPIDDYFEYGIVGKGDYYNLDGSSEYVVLDKKTVLQLVVNDYKLIITILKERFNIESILVNDGEPLYQYLELHYTKRVEHSYLYQDSFQVSNLKSKYTRRFATLDDIDMLIQYSNSPNMNEFLLNYYTNLIKNRGLFLYFEEDLVGTGEYRKSTTSLGYVNLGMTVAPNMQRQGIGTYILKDLKKLAFEENLKPICGTSSDNIASQKTIIKSGFILKNIVYEYFV